MTDIGAYIKDMIGNAPPLSRDQRDKLGLLLGSVAAHSAAPPMKGPAPMANPHQHSTECQWCRGYEEQAAWLEGSTLAEAEQSLTAREATLAPGEPYNDGCTVATRDYIARVGGVTS